MNSIVSALVPVPISTAPLLATLLTNTVLRRRGQYWIGADTLPNHAFDIASMAVLAMIVSALAMIRLTFELHSSP